MKQEFLIGELARRSGCNIQTIRYYEKIGLMPEPYRAANNRRLYQEGHLERLNFIRHSRELGFSLDDIREILELTDKPGRSCADVDVIAKNHLKQVRQKIATLGVMENELGRMIEDCEGGRVNECKIIKVLADHNLCQASEH